MQVAGAVTGDLEAKGCSPRATGRDGGELTAEKEELPRRQRQRRGVGQRGGFQGLCVRLAPRPWGLMGFLLLGLGKHYLQQNKLPVFVFRWLNWSPFSSARFEIILTMTWKADRRKGWI